MVVTVWEESRAVVVAGAMESWREASERAGEWYAMFAGWDAFFQGLGVDSWQMLGVLFATIALVYSRN